MTDLQRTEEWHGHRLGKATASRIPDVIATTRSGPAASRTNYMTDLLLERITGMLTTSFVSQPMLWGIEHEPRARSVFEFLEGLGVEPVGFVDHPTIKMSGASPDGLVGEDAVLEIKCPNSATHWDYLKGNVVPTKYKPQIQWQLACTGRKIAHFVSFDPRFPEELMYYHAWSPRDDAYIADLEEQVTKFLSELDMEEERARLMMRAAHLFKSHTELTGAA